MPTFEFCESSRSSCRVLTFVHPSRNSCGLLSFLDSSRRLLAQPTDEFLCRPFTLHNSSGGSPRQGSRVQPPFRIFLTSFMSIRMTASQSSAPFLDVSKVGLNSPGLRDYVSILGFTQTAHASVDAHVMWQHNQHLIH